MATKSLLDLYSEEGSDLLDLNFASFDSTRRAASRENYTFTPGPYVDKSPSQYPGSNLQSPTHVDNGNVDPSDSAFDLDGKAPKGYTVEGKGPFGSSKAQ